MSTENKREANQLAFRQLQETINKTYAPGRWVAIDDGKIIADAATFRELDKHLQETGMQSPDILVAEAGEDYSEEMVILAVRPRGSQSHSQTDLGSKTQASGAA
jgi:hypothetical protein